MTMALIAVIARIAVIEPGFTVLSLLASVARMALMAIQ